MWWAAYSFVGVPHPRWTVVIKLPRHGHKHLSRRMTSMPVNACRRYRIPATVDKTFLESLCRMLSRSHQKICIIQRFLKNLWRVKIWSVVPRTGRKPHLVPSSLRPSKTELNSVWYNFTELNSVWYHFTRLVLCCGCVPCSTSTHRTLGKQAVVPICRVFIRPGQ